MTNLQINTEKDGYVLSFSGYFYSQKKQESWYYDKRHYEEESKMKLATWNVDEHSFCFK